APATVRAPVSAEATRGASSCVGAKGRSAKHDLARDGGAQDACLSTILPRRGRAASTFFFAVPRSFSYVLLPTPLLTRSARASVTERSASATRDEFAGKKSAAGLFWDRASA